MLTPLQTHYWVLLLCVYKSDTALTPSFINIFSIILLTDKVWLTYCTFTFRCLFCWWELLPVAHGRCWQRMLWKDLVPAFVCRPHTRLAMLGVSVVAWADMCRGAGRLWLPAVCIRGVSVLCAAAGVTVAGDRCASLYQYIWLLTSVLADVLACILSVVVPLI